MSNDPIPHELLLSQAGFLRRLARDLVRDPAAAEDAVQEVWRRALEKPPREQHNLRAWMRAVLTNLVRTRARDESRRLAREREVARGEALMPPDESILRSVTEAVLALEEPLRGTVLQHYFQGLALAEIAQREHLPHSTVTSRLQRALELLRARLKREHGSGWVSGLIALTMPSKIGKGVILVSLKTKLALVGAALLGTWFVIQGWPDVKRSEPQIANSQESVAPAPASTEPDPVAKAPERSLPSTVPVEQPAVAGALPPDTLLYGTILDPAGTPWRGLLYEWVRINDASGTSRVVEAQIDGTYAFRGLPFGSYWVRVECDDLLAIEKQIELGREQPHMQCDFTLARAPQLKVRITTPEGENFADALKRARERDEAVRSLGFPFPVATLGPAEELFKEGGPRAHGLNGVGWFWDFGPRVKSLPKEYAGVLILLEHAPPVRVSLIGNQRVLQTTTAELGDEEVNFVLSLDQFLAGAATISLQVVDAVTLTPIRGARVDLEGEARALHGWTADANGMVLIRNHQPGEFQLRVSAPGHEDLTKVFLATPGATTALGQVLLGEEIQFEARVLDATGATCSAAFKLGVLDPTTREIAMQWRSSEELGDPTRETTTWRVRSYGSDNDGMLRIRHLGRRVYVLRPIDGLRQFNPADASARWTCGNVLIDLRSGVAPKEMEIRLERGSLLALTVKGGEAAGLRYRVLAADGLERATGEFRGSAPQSSQLPQGSYRVQLLDAGGRVLSEQSVTLGGSIASVELSR